MTGPFSAAPFLQVPSTDDARLAVFETLAGDTPPRHQAATPLLLVHGSGSDHTTWRVAGPLLAARRPVYAIDRRGRGASLDGAVYTAGREVDDLVAVADALTATCGRPIAVFGHSFGGRLALAAAPGTRAIERVIAYESAPAVKGSARAAGERLLDRLRDDVERGSFDQALARFLVDGAGLPPGELEAFRANPLWAQRVMTAPTIVRELDAALHDPAIGADALERIAVPVLQLVGSASPAWFRGGAEALDARLPHGSLVVIDGARHGAHHTHAAAVANAVEPFLDR